MKFVEKQLRRESALLPGCIGSQHCFRLRWESALLPAASGVSTASGGCVGSQHCFQLRWESALLLAASGVSTASGCVGSQHCFGRLCRESALHRESALLPAASGVGTASLDSSSACIIHIITLMFSTAGLYLLRSRIKRHGLFYSFLLPLQ